MSFSFSFADPSEAAGSEAAGSAAAPLHPPPRLRAAREISLGELRADSEEWLVEVLTIGSSDDSVIELHKPSLPEARAPVALCAELADLGDDTGSVGRPTADGASPCGSFGLAAGSDLAPNIYEGGFKTWECAHDLLHAMHEAVRCDDLQIQGASVLEAGCGVGLPGAYALKRGARTVVLQDYNASVLRLSTMQTLRINGLWRAAEEGRVRFISGDWSEVSALLLAEPANRELAGACDGHAVGVGSPLPVAGSEQQAGGSAHGFDVILSADTIYSPSSTRRLWKLVSEQLRRGGTALIAAKSYYFGVGGSVADFRSLVDADGRFECKGVRTFEDGASNRREVLSVRWRV